MKFKESFNAFFPLWGDQIVLSSTRFWDGKGNSCRMTEAENYETETPWHRPSSPGSPTSCFSPYFAGQGTSDLWGGPGATAPPQFLHTSASPGAEVGAAAGGDSRGRPGTAGDTAGAPADPAPGAYTTPERGKIPGKRHRGRGGS
ncbi:translation initiation factor IF-2-like isoform X4 [Parus major]|uniref:translation initiation factor IF-2-like isoform X4 n=1 Tax=Parus major TaxID=9157 RepID=UPI001443AFD7|nr:translation initiation factor IF-2-like isoform X4 [Parus major]